MQEYITTHKKENKNKYIYFTQKVELGIENEIGYELMWSGKVSKEEWNWSQEIANEQPNRVIINENNVICIKN